MRKMHDLLLKLTKTMYGNFYRIMAVSYLPEPQRTEGLAKIIEESDVDWGSIALNYMARILGRELTTEELEKILEKYIEKIGMLDKALKIVKLLGRELTTEELARILETNIENAYLDQSIKIAKILGRKLTTKELTKILEKYIERYVVRSYMSNDRFEDVFKVAKLLKRELTTEELTKMLERHIKNGLLGGALEIAKLLGRELTTEELTKMLERVTKNVWRFDEALEIAKLLGRELTTKELTKFIKRCVRPTSIPHVTNFENARKAMSYVTESQRTYVFAEILEKYIDDGQLDYACDIVYELLLRVN